MRLRRLSDLALASHPAPTVAVTLVGALLAVAVGLPAGRGALFAAAVLTGQLSIGWSNDYVDQARDAAAGRTDKPAATGAVARSVLAPAAAGALVATVALSLLVGLRAGAVALVLVAAGWAYNLGLKATVASAAAYAIGFGALPAAAYLAAGSSPPWWAPVAGALLGIGAHFANVLPDLHDDVELGVRGLPQRLGAGRSVAVLLVTLGGAAVALAVGSPDWLRAGLLAVTAVVLVVAAAAARRDPASPMPFRCGLLLALLDVLGLVLAAR